MNYEIKKIIDRVYLIDFKDHYDLCMLFLRYQEFYESPNPNFRGKSFDLISYREWYAKTAGGGSFAYPVDWAGFNIPSSIIDKVQALGIPDKNKYDNEMEIIHNKIKQEVGDIEYYIIGASNGNETTLKHELAHSLFFTNSEYKQEMTDLVLKLSDAKKASVEEFLRTGGYVEDVFIDEIQAYFATDISEDIDEEQPFIETFNKYMKLYGKFQ